MTWSNPSPSPRGEVRVWSRRPRPSCEPREERRSTPAGGFERLENKESGPFPEHSPIAGCIKRAAGQARVRMRAKDTGRHVCRMIGSRSGASAPPAIMISAAPRAICCAAKAMAYADDAHVADTVRQGPPRPGQSTECRSGCRSCYSQPMSAVSTSAGPREVDGF